MDKERAIKRHTGRTLVQNERDLSVMKNTISLSVRKVREIMAEEILILEEIIKNKKGE